ncbi:iron-containing redox enzyme family protein [Cyanobacteria bacterium FACHB-472]|nr:iron-containing redox enzyme family protein [Cyanobacteria bacterium FACHB-472]
MQILERTLPPAEEIVRLYEQQTLAEHPIFQRLKQEPVNLTAIWIFTMNMNVEGGVSKNFVRWLANLAARIDDNYMRSIIAKQLNEELGEGDFSRIHSVMLQRMVDGLEPWRLADYSEELLAPGREFGQRGEKLFFIQDPYEGLGGFIASEVSALQIDQCLGQEIRRQNAIASEKLTWITLHEELEVDHVEEVVELARLVPTSEEKLQAVWRGAQEMRDAIIAFLDGVYRVSFP